MVLFIFFDFISRAITGFQGNSADGLKRHLLFLVFLFTIVGISNRKILLRIVFVVFIFTAVISIYELIIYATTLKELMKTSPWEYIRINVFSYPLTEGQIKMLVLMFTLPLLFMKEKLPLNKALIITLYIPIFISMFLTQSRNVYLGIAAAVLVYGIIENRKLLITALSVVIILWIFAPQSFKDRIESIVDVNQPSNRARLVMWSVSYQIFLDYPVFGLGERVDHFEDIYSNYKDIDPKNWGEGTHLHNNLLMILVTNGLFGLIFFAGFFIIIFIKQIKYFRSAKDRLDRLILLGSILAMISFHVAGLFDYNYRDQKVVPMMFFFTAIGFTVQKFRLTEPDNAENDYSKK
jgi:O-antigen ligase